MMNADMVVLLAQLDGNLRWEWARPIGLWALLLPLLLWLLSRLRAEPPALATGTLLFWKRVAASHPQRATGARRRTPPWLWVLACALGLGALALAGPRLLPPEPPRTWTVVVDHSPSTSLPADPAGDTRLDLALESALDWLGPRLRAGDRVRWVSSARAGLELPGGRRPERRWLLHPRWFAPPPRWALFDEPGTLWVTDAVPSEPPRLAGLFTSGGELVPGPVSASGTTRWDWDGEELVEVPGALAPRALVLVPDERAVPEPVRVLAEVWARERGLVAGPAADLAGSDLALALQAEPEVERVALDVGRDGWRARVEGTLPGVAPLDTKAPQESWLAAEHGAGPLVLVHASPGLVRLALRSMEEPTGDPAAFAYSWSRLFERWLLPAEGVVPLAERLAAGEPVERGTEPPATAAGAAAPAPFHGDELDAWLAAAAALLGAVALSAHPLWRR